MTINPRQVLKRLQEYKCDPESLLVQAETVYNMCLVEGILTEKVAGKDKIELLERLPAVAVQAINTKLAVVKWLVEQAEKEADISVSEPLTINVVYSEPKVK